jgi:hypothetical protein
MNFKPKSARTITSKTSYLETLIIPLQSLNTGGKMFMPEKALFLHAKSSVDLMVRLQNEF